MQDRCLILDVVCIYVIHHVIEVHHVIEGNRRCRVYQRHMCCILDARVHTTRAVYRTLHVK